MERCNAWGDLEPSRPMALPVQGSAGMLTMHNLHAAFSTPRNALHRDAIKAVPTSIEIQSAAMLSVPVGGWVMWILIE